MTDKEVMQQALDALESLQAWPETPENFKRFRAIEALRTALAQPEKEVVGLTGQEVKKIFKDCGMSYSSVHLAMQIEAKLKEKNT